MDSKPKITVLGIDIGLNNIGWTTANIIDKKLEFTDCGHFTVSKPTAKYKGTQLVIKAIEMLNQLDGAFYSRKFDAVAIETPGGNTQSAGAAKALGACAVLVGDICRHFRGKTVLVKPSDVKKCVKEKGPVEKDEVMEYVWNKYFIPNVQLNKEQVYIKAHYEHIADSALVLEAALKTSLIFKGLING